MDTNVLGCCAHPTTVLLIEDDPIFAQILKRRLEQLQCRVLC